MIMNDCQYKNIYTNNVFGSNCEVNFLIRISQNNAKEQNTCNTTG